MTLTIELNQYSTTTDMAWRNIDAMCGWLFEHVGGELDATGKSIENLEVRTFLGLEQVDTNGSMLLLASRARQDSSVAWREWSVRNEFWSARIFLIYNYTRYHMGEVRHYAAVDVFDETKAVMFKLAAPWE